MENSSLMKLFKSQYTQLRLEYEKINNKKLYLLEL